MRAAHAALLLALPLAACKFPFPPDVNDDGRPPSDATGTDGAPPSPLTIAFVSDRTGNDDIFTMSLPNTTGHPTALNSPSRAAAPTAAASIASTPTQPACKRWERTTGPSRPGRPMVRSSPPTAAAP